MNLTSAWWFEKTRDIIQNQVISIPDPNVTLAKKCEVFPIEFVVRGFITGSTSTSLWTVYNNGNREYCGNQLPEGLKKNQKLDKNISEIYQRISKVIPDAVSYTHLTLPTIYSV